MNISVTQADINAGRIARTRPDYVPACDCPIALALRRQGYPEVSVQVGGGGAYMRLPQGRFPLPPEAYSFMWWFDNRSVVKPFDFEAAAPFDSES